jgi:hypothetical protein
MAPEYIFQGFPVKTGGPWFRSESVAEPAPGRYSGFKHLFEFANLERR